MQINFNDFETIELTNRGEAIMYINKSYITFSNGLVEEMGAPAYIRFLINPKTKILVLQKCNATDKNAFKFANANTNGSKTRYTSVKVLLATIISLLDNYDENKFYGLKGEYDAEQEVYIMDINNVFERNVDGFRRFRKK